MELLLLNQEQVQSLLDLDELLEGLTQGFIALSEGRVIAPNRNEIDFPGVGHLLAKPAWMPGNDMTVKLVSTFYGNRYLGMPVIQALINLFDPATGTPLAVINGTYLTAIRTAACSALSVKILARKNSRILTIIGAGVQGQTHLKMLQQVRNFKEMRIASLYREDAQKFASDHPGVQFFESYEDAVRGADVVCLCTTSNTPVISIDWLSPGVHVTSIGYSLPGGELPIEIIKKGRLAVETRLSFEPPPTGCGELTGLDPAIGTELGELLSGKAPGRKSKTQLTVFKSMGHAMEDMVAANIIYRKALHKGVGHFAAF